MIKYHTEGGRSDPDFSYKVRVDYPTNEMFDWCNEYPTKGSFGRYYVRAYQSSQTRHITHAIFSFEIEEPSIMFALRWL
jgi:hypothetical protein